MFPGGCRVWIVVLIIMKSLEILLSEHWSKMKRSNISPDVKHGSSSPPTERVAWSRLFVLRCPTSTHMSHGLGWYSSTWEGADHTSHKIFGQSFHLLPQICNFQTKYPETPPLHSPWAVLPQSKLEEGSKPLGEGRAESRLVPQGERSAQKKKPRGTLAS